MSSTLYCGNLKNTHFCITFHSFSIHAQKMKQVATMVHGILFVQEVILFKVTSKAATSLSG